MWEKTEEDKNISFAKRLADFAEDQKKNPENGFDADRDKMVIVFDGDIFEAKVQGYGCFGFDTFGPFKIVGGIKKGHPTDEEIEDAVRFYQGLDG